MKLIYSLSLLIISFNTYSRDIIVIENVASDDLGILVQSILINKFNLPKELITLKQNQKHCSEHSDAVVSLCINSNEDLEIKKMNSFIVKNSLGVFINQKNFEEGERR